MSDPAKDPKDPQFEGPCPRCGGGVPNNTHQGEYPGALSRLDNETYICSECGTNEAFNAGHLVPFDIPLLSEAGQAFRDEVRGHVPDWDADLLTCKQCGWVHEGDETGDALNRVWFDHIVAAGRKAAEEVAVNA